MSATTDSDMIIKYDPELKPGISNLINIYSALTDKSISDIEEEFKDSNYGNFKKVIADTVVEFILNIQKKYEYYLNSSKLDEILDSGIKKARMLAKMKYEQVKKNINMYRK